VRQPSPLSGLNPKDWGLAELIVGLAIIAVFVAVLT
jgi:hypothetical protein